MGAGIEFAVFRPRPRQERKSGIRVAWHTSVGEGKGRNDRLQWCSSCAEGQTEFLELILRQLQLIRFGSLQSSFHITMYGHSQRSLRTLSFFSCIKDLKVVGTSQTKNSALQLENKPKNRYNNVLPCE